VDDLRVIHGAPFLPGYDHQGFRLMASTPKTAAAATTTSTQAPAKPVEVFPPFDASTFVPQLIWLALTFGFLYFALSKYLLPRITDVIDARQDGIARDLSRAEALKKETEDALAAYEKALADAKAKGNDIAKTTRDSLTAETDRERVKVEGDLAKQAAAAEARIADSKTKALASVNDIAGETVAAIVAKLTGGTVSADDAKRAVAAVRGK
jgi:F-type H+-transporting ATPase subunit b